MDRLRLAQKREVSVSSSVYRGPCSPVCPARSSLSGSDRSHEESPSSDGERFSHRDEVESKCYSHLNWLKIYIDKKTDQV